VPAVRAPRPILGAVLAVGTALLGGPQPAFAASAKEIRREANAALSRLYASTPAAKALGAQAKGILVFPRIVKAGFIVGAQGGDGALRKGDQMVAYYRNVAASYGLQAGVQGFSYALFFMSDSALAYLDKSDGWEIGTGPSLVIVDKGMARSLSTTTLRSDVYAFIFGQKGLMAGIGIQGSKITRIHPK
jgi:lipid-binding SYLF domain-containing protein